MAASMNDTRNIGPKMFFARISYLSLHDFMKMGDIDELEHELHIFPNYSNNGIHLYDPSRKRTPSHGSMEDVAFGTNDNFMQLRMLRYILAHEFGYVNVHDNNNNKDGDNVSIVSDTDVRYCAVTLLLNTALCFHLRSSSTTTTPYFSSSSFRDLKRAKMFH
eukprot:scaffold1555_cov173-Amphora_coffeaeformis.AAC.21